MRKDGDVPPVGGYVLAGGKSSRMGTNKALLPLAGKPLVEHAVTKLRRLCAEVKILGSDPALEAYAPLVRDVHAECGPMGGIEAALLDSRFEWNLILPVDMPFLPTDFLKRWLWAVLHRKPATYRLAVMSVDAMPQPTLLLIHKEVALLLTESLEAGRYKLFPALEEAARSLAGRAGVRPDEVFWQAQYDDRWALEKTNTMADGQVKTPAPRASLRVEGSRLDRFANLNTPEEFAEAERFAAELDT